MNAAAEQDSSEFSGDEMLQAGTGTVLSESDSSNDAYEPDRTVRAEGLNSELANKWLVWQCKMIADVITGVVYDANGNMLAMRPANGTGADKLAIAGQQVYENNMLLCS